MQVKTKHTKSMINSAIRTSAATRPPFQAMVHYGN